MRESSNPINSKSVHLKVPFPGDMKPGKGLVIGYAKWREGLIKVNSKPIDTDVEIAAEYEGHDRGRQYPEVYKNRCIVYDSTTTGKRVKSPLTYVAPRHCHHLSKRGSCTGIIYKKCIALSPYAVTRMVWTLIGLSEMIFHYPPKHNKKFPSCGCTCYVFFMGYNYLWYTIYPFDVQHNSAVDEETTYGFIWRHSLQWSNESNKTKPPKTM